MPRVPARQRQRKRPAARQPTARRQARGAQSSTVRPVLDKQPLHSRKLARIAGHKRQCPSQRLARSQHVMAANRNALDGKGSADVTRMPCVLAIEGHDLEPRLVHERQILVVPLALQGTEVQLVHNDGRQAKVRRLQRSDPLQGLGSARHKRKALWLAD